MGTSDFANWDGGISVVPRLGELLKRKPRQALSLLEKLNNGEKIKCMACGKGYMLKCNPEIEKNFFFYCSECGEIWQFAKPIIIE